MEPHSAVHLCKISCQMTSGCLMNQEVDYSY